ncbi:MAG TPA: hypothetical protein VE567_05870 [Sphingomonas sp.]|nr:hypothetical protein [Sphingomonas sp.]
MKRLSRMVAAAGLALTALATAAGAARLSPEAQLEKLVAGRAAGKPVDCINLRDVQNQTIIDKTAIVFRIGSKLYVNRPSGGANQLDNDDILITKTFGSQLCRIDTVRLLDRASRIPHGFVSLGDFVPYTKPR